MCRAAPFAGFGRVPHAHPRFVRVGLSFRPFALARHSLQRPHTPRHLGRNLIFRHFQVVSRLQVHPERHCSIEIPRKPQRRIGGNCPPFLHNIPNPVHALPTKAPSRASSLKREARRPQSNPWLSFDPARRPFAICIPPRPVPMRPVSTCHDPSRSRPLRPRV